MSQFQLAFISTIPADVQWWIKRLKSNIECITYNVPLSIYHDISINMLTESNYNRSNWKIPKILCHLRHEKLKRKPRWNSQKEKHSTVSANNNALNNWSSYARCTYAERKMQMMAFHCTSAYVTTTNFWFMMIDLKIYKKKFISFCPFTCSFFHSYVCCDGTANLILIWALKILYYDTWCIIIQNYDTIYRFTGRKNFFCCYFFFLLLPLSLTLMNDLSPAPR